MLIPVSNFAQMVGSDAYVKATSVEIGLDGAGGFEGCNTSVSPPLPGMHYRSGTVYFGFVANPQVDGWTNFNGDFFTPGTPENGWGVEVGSASGIVKGNNCNALNEIPGSITSWTHTFDCYSADWQGDLTSGTNLHFKVNYFMQETDLFYTTTVSITNNTASTIPELYYYRNVDPDNNEYLSGDFSTTNSIVSEPGSGCNLAHVSATQAAGSGADASYLGFAGVGANFRVCYGGFSNRDASDLWTGTGFTQTVGSSATADEAIALSYKIVNLAPGATETFKFVVILDDASASNAINNLLYLSYPGSASLPPAVCTPYIDTARTCGAPVPISVAGTTVGGFNWTWTPSTGLSTTTGPSVVANPPTTTTYTVTGTPTSPCYSPVTMEIVVKVTPAGAANPVIASVPPVCVSAAPFNMTADSVGGAWSGTGITNSSTGTFDPSVAGPGTFLITYTMPGACAGLDTAYVTVGTASDPTITPTPTVCVGDASFNLTAATSGGTWSGTGITNTTTGTFDPATAGVGSYVVTYSLSGGTCTATDTVTVNVTGLYDATITSHLPVCEGSTAFTLSAATGGGTWSGTGITNASTGAYSPTTAGTDIITYTISGSCGNTDTLHLTIVPNADATITSVSPVCVNSPAFNLTAATSGGTWSGTGITNASSGTYTPSTAGTFTVTYSIGGMCGDTATQSVTVNALPTPGFGPTSSVGCAPLCVNFNETGSATCNSVIYYFGTTGDSATVSSPNYCFANPGSYDVTIVCQDNNGCIGTSTVTNAVTVNAVPVANFTVSPGGAIAPNTSATFTDISTGGGTASWDFGDIGSGASNFDSGTPVSHTYANEGDYCIEMISDNAGCVDTARQCIIVIGDATIVIPNVFTPNGDGTNDVWIITTTGVAELTGEVYDRWGLKMSDIRFDATTGYGYWDGKAKNGKYASDGTYYYIMNVTGFNGKTYDEKGYIQLIQGK